ncbi:MAG: type II CAAX endopeptidase family protein [Candidatus Thorarchaeota archaeon]|jgi:membrane protease YdiL (CAAX protease family)
MDDPDLYELEEATDIGIFEPGTHLESGIDKNQMIGVLGYTALGMVLMVIATMAIMFPLLMTPLIVIDFYSYSIYIDPLALLIMTVAEIVFVIPPMYYIRKRGLPKSAIGIKNMLSGKDALLGIFIGLLMIGANFVISWIVTTTTGPPAPGSQDLLVARNLAEMIAWTLTMFVFVGFTEELLFRGFMQRRMEMYFRGRGTGNYKLVALLISSFIFGIIHFDLVGLPARFVLGIFLGDLAQRRNYNILGPSVAHGMNNAIVVILSSLGF